MAKTSQKTSSESADDVLEQCLSRLTEESCVTVLQAVIDAGYEVNLQSFPRMPLNVVKLLGAEIITETTGDEFKAAVRLWATSWHQVPAGTLPDNDRFLAKAAGYEGNPRAWKKIKTAAMRGWKLITNDRWFHETMAEVVLDTLKVQRGRKKGGQNRNKGTKSEQGVENKENGSSSSTSSAHLYIGAAAGAEAGAQAPAQGVLQSRIELNGIDNTPLPPKGEAAWDQIFEDRFWPAYPKRAGSNPKKPAKQKFIAACKRGVDPELIIAGAKAYAASPSTKVGSEYVATTVVWLNQERWEQYASAQGAADLNGHKHTHEIPTIVPGFPPEVQVDMAKGYLLDGRNTPDLQGYEYTGPKPKDQRRWFLKDATTRQLLPGPGEPGCPVHPDVFARIAREYGAEWP